MKKLTFPLVILALLSLSSCKEKIITFADNGNTIYLAIDQVLKIELPGNASTGNKWRNIQWNGDILEKTGRENFIMTDDRDGAAGNYYFRFKGKTEGSCNITMEYGSKYDSQKVPLRTFTVEVIVVNQHP